MLPSSLCNRRRPCGIEYGSHIIKKIRQLVSLSGKIHPHHVAIQVPASLSQIVGAHLYPVLAGIHSAEIAEAQIPELIEFFIFMGIGMPVGHIRSEGIKYDITGTSEKFLIDVLIPPVGVPLHILKAPASHVPVSPAVG